MRKRRSEQDGFALLLVLLLAAGIAISLYMEMPRIAFETQRNREEMLVDRGEQYKRAIQLFVRANKRYPTKIEDLESFNDKRYLRHRFVDPITGKDDWRLVHVGPTGMLTDSLVQKNDNPLGGKDDKNKDQTASNTDAGNGDPNTQPAGWDAKRQRPSDVMQLASTGTGTPPPGSEVQPQPGYVPPQYPVPQQPGQPAGQPGQPGQPFPGQPGQPFPGQPGQPFPGQPGQPFPGQPTGQPGQPGQPFPGQQIPGQTGQTLPAPGQQFPGQQFPGQLPPGQQPVPPYPGQPIGTLPMPGQPMPGQPMPGQYPGQLQPYPGQSVQPYPGQPNVQPQATPPNSAQTNAGIGAVRAQIFGASPNQSAFANNPQQGGLGTGIAGVGVPAEIKGQGIMLIKDRSKYKEWEFIYDPKEDKNIVGPAGANQGMPQNPNQNPFGQRPPTAPR